MNTTRFTTLAGLATSALLVGAVAGVGIRPVDAALHALWTRSPAAAAAGCANHAPTSIASTAAVAADATSGG